MLASELLGSKWLDEHKDIDITGIAYDSRNVLPGNIFVCIKGFETDGHKYAEMAVKNGASLIVAEDKIDVDVPVWYVENSRVEIAEMACKYYGNPSSKFKLIGITGTNGKTTITYLIKSIIETAGMRIGVIGTNQNIIGDKVLVTQSTTPTTPNALELQQLFAEMVDSDAECVVMEVSSHALELERVHGCHFDVGVFTNLTRDHLDFHKTMENYLNAKAKLFKISDKGVVNFDDDGGKKIVANNDCDILKVGLSDGCDLKAKNIEISSNSDGQSSVTNKATIYGDLNYSSSSEASIPEGTVTGSVNYSPITTSTKSKSISSYILALGRFIVTVLVIWLLYLWLAPKFLENTGALLSKKLLPVIGSGILTPIIFVIAFVLLLILGLTSNIAIIGTMLFAVLLMISNSTFVIAINNLVCKKFNISKNTTTFGVLIITSAVIWLLELIPVVGSILNFVIMIIGLGILVTAIIPEKEKSNKNSKKEEIKK